MDTARFRTKTELLQRDNGDTGDKWEVALDIGYSSVKALSPNVVASFPAYARRVGPSFQYAGKAPKTSILYRDLGSGEIWLVGEVAQDTMTSGDTSDSEMSLYGRERYGNPMFRVITEAGLGLAATKNVYGDPGDKRMIVQTGLPERYLSDTPDLKDVIAGKHSFELRLGSGEWKRYEFSISPDDVYVMSQPKGTLFSVCVQRDGKYHPDAQKYLTSSLLVFDPGFGTLDLFPIRKGVVGKGETNQVLGMRRVMEETAKLIGETYGIEVTVPEMQKYLVRGAVPYFDKKKMESEEKPFDSLLSVANEAVCNEAIEWLINAVNLVEYNYMIITGGTGAAWQGRIKEKLKGMSTLKIIDGSQNDTLPMIYSNARGYYYYRYMKLKA